MTSLLLSNPANEPFEFDKLVSLIKTWRDNNTRMMLKKKTELLKSIRPEFLKNLLSNVDTDAMSEYKKLVASRVLVEFCEDKKLIKHPNIVVHAAEMLKIVCLNGETSDSEYTLEILHNAYLYLVAICQTFRGQLALIHLTAIPKLCQLYLTTCKYDNLALNILSTLIVEHHYSWGNEDPMIFHKVMNKMASNFRHEYQITKSCERMKHFLYLCPLEICTSNWKHQTWPQDIYQEVEKILSATETSVLHWNGALTLAPTVLNMLGVEWISINPKQSKNFFILLVCSMLTELDERIKKKALKTINVSVGRILDCLTTLELLLLYSDVEKFEFDEKDKDSINTLLPGVFQTLTKFLDTLFNRSEIMRSTTYLEHRYILVMVRFLSTWIYRNKVFIQLDVNTTLPIILATANKSFYAYRQFNTLTTIDEAREKISSIKWIENFDVLRQILFSIAILASDNGHRKILLQNHQDRILLDCLEYYWAIFHHQVLSSHENAKIKILNYSRWAVIEVVVIFRFIVENDWEYIKKSPLKVHLREFLLNNYSKLPNSQDNLALSGHLAVLGIRLLPMDNLAGDPRAVRFLDVAIQFLQDVCETSVTREDVSSVCLLCMHIIPYYARIVLSFLNLSANSNYLRRIIAVLLKITNQNIRLQLGPVYEALFRQIFQPCPILAVELKDCGLLNVCKDYYMTELVKIIDPNII